MIPPFDFDSFERRVEALQAKFRRLAWYSYIMGLMTGLLILAVTLLMRGN